jgi:hypothetical protein
MDFDLLEKAIDTIIDNNDILGKYNDCEYFSLEDDEKRKRVFNAIKEIPNLINKDLLISDIVESNALPPQFCIIEVVCMFMELELMGVTSLEGIKSYKVGEIEVELDKYYSQLNNLVSKYCSDYFYNCWNRC